MSGYQAYLSFAKFMKVALSDSGIQVTTEKVEGLTYPYLVIQDGPDMLMNRHISNRMIQGWVVVKKEDGCPLVDSMGRALGKVIDVSRDPGQIEKYDLPDNPEIIKGFLFAEITEVSGLMPGTDPNIWRRVITWELQSNAN